MGKVVKPEAINHPINQPSVGVTLHHTKYNRGIAIINILWGLFLIGFSTIQSLRTK